MQKLGVRDKYRNFLILTLTISLSYYFGNAAKAFQESLFGFILPIILVFGYFVLINNILFEVKNFLLLTIIMIYLMFSWLIVGGGIGSLVNNFTCIIYCFIFYEVSFSKDEVALCLKIINVFHLSFFIIVFWVGYDSGYIGIYNANVIAMQAVLDLLFFDVFPCKNNLLLFIQNLSSIVIIIYCSARTALFSVFGFYILLLWKGRHKVKKIWIKLLFWVLTILGVLIPILLVLMYSNFDRIMHSNLMTYSMKFFNKSVFTGREVIWGVALEKLFKSFQGLWLGIGTHALEGVFPGSNFHNSFLTIIICSGFLGFFLMMLLVYRVYKQRVEMQTSIAIRSCLAYLAFMSIGIFESTLFSGHFAILGFLLLSFGVEDEQRVRIK